MRPRGPASLAGSRPTTIACRSRSPNVALALILSTTISLFWLVALLAAHMTLEWIARVRRGDRRHSLIEIVSHVKLDVALILFALVLGLYFDVLFGLLGLGALARTGAQMTTRFVGWQRGLRTVLLAADDVALAAKAAAHRLRGAAVSTGPGEPEPAAGGRPRMGRWSRTDVAVVVLAVVCAFLIAAAPILTVDDVRGVRGVLATELHPWPR